MTLPADSRQAREQVRSALASISIEDAKSLSQALCSRFCRSWQEIAEPRGVRWRGLSAALYRAMEKEPDLTSVDQYIRAAGASVCFPRLKDRAKKLMEFVEVPSIADEAVIWEEGPYGIEEPHSSLKPIEDSQIQLVFVPGLAFGQSGERIGRGAGYYDRFLSGNRVALRVALIFDFQLFSALEQNPWDQPVDWIVTDSREIRTERLICWLEERSRAP